MTFVTHMKNNMFQLYVVDDNITQNIPSYWPMCTYNKLYLVNNEPTPQYRHENNNTNGNAMENVKPIVNINKWRAIYAPTTTRVTKHNKPLVQNNTDLLVIQLCTVLDRMLRDDHAHILPKILLSTNSNQRNNMKRIQNKTRQKTYKAENECWCSQ